VIYPKINLAIGYEVDPDWPQKPKDIAWGHIPGVGVDSKDRVWIFARAEVPVQCYDVRGNYECGWGQGTIKRAHHLTVDHEDNIWLADHRNHVVQKYTSEGELLMTLGVAGVPGCDESHLNEPTDMAVTATGEIFVADGYGNNRVVHFDPQGQFIKAWGELGVQQGQFSLPHCIVVDSQGHVYVGGRNNVRVQVFDYDGNFLDEWRNLMVPWGMHITSDDEIWVCGSTPMRWEEDKDQLGGPPKDQIFAKFNPEGKILQLWTVPKCADGQEKPGACNWIHGFALDSHGNIYVGDIQGQRVQKFIRLESDA